MSAHADRTGQPDDHEHRRGQLDDRLAALHRRRRHPLRGVPAVRHQQRVARRAGFDLVHVPHPAARYLVHAQTTGHRPERRPVGAFPAGDISIADTGPDPITGWTLAFGFPATTESFSSGWNATYAPAGQNVVVTPVDGGTNLTANSGNTVGIGFVGNQTGANPPPASFTLNGTVCTTPYTS
jgi:hypothetical protein